MIIAKNGNLRSGPSTNDTIIGKVTVGLKVIQLDKSEKWHKVKLSDGKVGWIHQILVIKEGKKQRATQELIKAASEGNISLLKEILDKGINVNSKNDSSGATALHLAAINGHVDIVKLLLDKDADVNAKDNDNWTPLLVAAYKGHNETLKILIDKGADVNAKSIDGWTALMYLCHGKMSISMSQSGHTEIVKSLIDKGADVNIKNNSGKTALDIAYYSGYIDLIELLAKRTTK